MIRNSAWPQGASGLDGDSGRDTVGGVNVGALRLKMAIYQS